MGESIKPGEILTDLTGKKWRLGRSIGVGGFGEIYSASDVLNREVQDDSSYVVKIEHHTNGPLFVEINCYLRTAKLEMIEEWKKDQQLQHLGMPHYVASGSHVYKGSKYRFLVLPRYERDLDVVLRSKKKFNLKTVLTIATQIIDILKYLHQKGYVHCDIKASNILIGSPQCLKEETVASSKPVFYYRGCNPIRKCRIRQNIRRSQRVVNYVHYRDDIPNFEFFEKLLLINDDTSVKGKKIDKVYLLDYGLATKYRKLNNVHKPYCVDERRKHAGTILFCSRDAHKGAQSRRSDLECLGYNMISWLGGHLPWAADVEDPEVVDKKKRQCMNNVGMFLMMCFDNCPKFLLSYFNYLKKLDFETEPDYELCKRLFKDALKDYGYKDNGKLDFDSIEGWGLEQKMKKNFENRTKKISVIPIGRLPFQSNFSMKSPKMLRKKSLANLNWSKILMDPEIIIKKQKRTGNVKLSESSDLNPSSVLNMDIYQLNPTYAMIEVFNKSKERLSCGSGNNSPNYKSESEVENVNGYTPAMLAIYTRMKEREAMECDSDSEDDYYYKFPTKKQPTGRGVTKRTAPKRTSAITKRKRTCR